MADDVKEAPRGKQLFDGINGYEITLASAMRYVNDAGKYYNDDNINMAVFNLHGACYNLTVYLQKLHPLLQQLASRGFFDDNRMELTKEVLLQLKETPNAPAK